MNNKFYQYVVYCSDWWNILVELGWRTFSIRETECGVRIAKMCKEI